MDLPRAVGLWRIGFIRGSAGLVPDARLRHQDQVLRSCLVRPQHRDALPWRHTLHRHCVITPPRKLWCMRLAHEVLNQSVSFP